MKQILLLVLLFPLFLNAQTVTVFTDDFGSGCDADNPVTNYNPPSGTWTVTETGTNYTTANIWYVSAAENGNDAGECGSGCGNDRTLHIGSDPSVMGDIGAAYFEGLAAWCNLFGCGATDKRVESPTLDCTGLTSIHLEFVYIEGGNTIDNATLWYYDGATWSQIANMAKTVGACSPQGTWTLYNITLPVSAENNPNVKIGFRWINNDNGVASDPSVAIDDVLVTGETSIADITPPVISCPPGLIVVCGPLPDFTGSATVTDDLDPSPSITQSPAPGTFIISGPITFTFTATDNAGNESTCSFDGTFSDLIPPSIVCPLDVAIQVAQGSGDVQIASGTIGFPASDDDCSFPTITNDHPSDMYPVGITLITWTATDGAGNEIECVQTITVTEDQSPIITCPGMSTYSCVALSDFTTDANVTDDNDPSPTVEQSPAAGTMITEDLFVTLTATDNVGNISTCTFMVMYQDDEDPFITCPADMEVVGDINGEATVTALNLGVAVATDNCSVPIVSNDHPSEIFMTGNTSVTWTAIDAFGNISTCLQTVNVIVDQPPVVFCPGEITDMAAPPSCTPQWSTGCADDMVDRVTITAPNGEVIMDTGNTGCSGTPSSWSVSPTTTTLLQGNSYTVRVYSDILFNEYFGVWFDLNNDGSFDGPGEFLGSNSTPAIVAAFNLQVPNDLYLIVQRRLRVIADWNSPRTSADYCASETWGEGEDFLLTINSANLSIECNELPYYLNDVVVSDDFDDMLDLIQDPPVGTIISSDTEVTVTATDNAGNSSSC